MNTDDLSARPFDVVGFCLNTLDLIAVIDGFPEPDTKVRFQELDIQGGGIVATAMAACARLGLRTRYVCKVGGDFWSRLALRSLSAEGIDVRHVIRMKGSPGQLGIVLADRSTGERTILFRRPPSYSVRPEEITREAITAGRLLHVDSMDAAAALQAVKWAREASMRITMDGDRFVPGVEEVLSRVDLLVCNPRFLRTAADRERLEEALQVLADRGPSRVAVTLAADGAQGYESGRWVRAPGFPVQVVDSNGAGDVFHGACAFGELRGWPFDWVLTFASAVAAMKCRALGGRRGIPRLPEVAEFLTAVGSRDIAAALG